MSLIKLTTTETHEYFAVPLPMDARKIYKENLAGYYFLHHECNIEDEGWREIESDFELLGVIGNGEDISQEIAQEVSEATLGIKITHHPKDKPDYINWLKFKLIEKGILVENPIEKPLPIKGLENNMCYLDKLDDWQSYESKLVKAVILKIKK